MDVYYEVAANSHRWAYCKLNVGLSTTQVEDTQPFSFIECGVDVVKETMIQDYDLQVKISAWLFQLLSRIFGCLRVKTGIPVPVYFLPDPTRTREKLTRPVPDPQVRVGYGYTREY